MAHNLPGSPKNNAARNNRQGYEENRFVKCFALQALDGRRALRKVRGIPAGHAPQQKGHPTMRGSIYDEYTRGAIDALNTFREQIINFRSYIDADDHPAESLRLILEDIVQDLHREAVISDQRIARLNADFSRRIP